MSENFEKIKAASLFWGIEEAELPELLEALDARSRRYQKGEIIMPEGEKTDSLGLVMSGNVLIALQNQVRPDFVGDDVEALFNGQTRNFLEHVARIDAAVGVVGRIDDERLGFIGNVFFKRLGGSRHP